MISGISQSTSAMSGVDFTAMMKNRREEMFAQIDANGDGSLDKAELETWKQNRPEPPADMPQPPEGAAKPPDDPFADMDTDGDGLVSKAEFDTANEKMDAERQAMMTEQTASASQISAENLKTLLEALQKESDESGSNTSILRQYAGSILASIQPSVDLVG